MLRDLKHYLVIFLAGTAALAMANTNAWDAGGGADTEWSNPLNWAGIGGAPSNIVPAATDVVYIGHSAYSRDAIATISNAEAACLWLGLGYDANTTGTITLTSGRLQANALAVGYRCRGIFIHNGGTTEVGSAGLSLGAYLSTSTGSYSLVDSGVLTVNGNAHIGYTGKGIFYQATGTTLIVDSNFCVGVGLGGTADGSYTMSGGVIRVGTAMYIGLYQGNKADFYQANGTIHVSNDYFLGMQRGSATHEIVNGRLEKGNLGNRILYVGAGGTGTLIIGESAVVSNEYGDVRIGENSGGYNGQGTVVMRGGFLYGHRVRVRVQTNDFGMIRGWGNVTNYGTYTYMDGVMIADGSGLDRDLGFFYPALYRAQLNGLAGTNGWYAQNHGRLVLKPIPVTGNGSYFWGESTSLTNLDLVNGVKIVLNGVSGSGTLTGALYASDRNDVPLYAHKTSRFAGLWRFATNGFAFSSAHLYFRYDHLKAAALGIPEDSLNIYSHSGTTNGTWQQIADYAVMPISRNIVASNLTAFAFFAVGAGIMTPPNGTIFSIQ